MPNPPKAHQVRSLGEPSRLDFSIGVRVRALMRVLPSMQEVVKRPIIGYSGILCYVDYDCLDVQNNVATISTRSAKEVASND